MQTPDFYEDLAKVKDAYYDMSNYPQESQLYSERNKAIPGFFKDETAGCPIKSFVGLRSKVGVGK